MAIRALAGPLLQLGGLTGGPAPPDALCPKPVKVGALPDPLLLLSWGEPAVHIHLLANTSEQVVPGEGTEELLCSV